MLGGAALAEQVLPRPDMLVARAPGQLLDGGGVQAGEERMRTQILRAARERRTVAVIERGQRAGTDPRRVAEIVLRSRDPAPARYYLAESQKWYLRASRMLPPSVVESQVARRFRLAG
jgi:hypothetical protein